jgi:hypothetical protein
VGGGLLAKELEGAGAEELEGADPGCGSHGRRSGDPEAGRAGSRGSPRCNAERSAANAPVRLTCAALEAARTMRRAARSRSIERRWGRGWINPVRLMHLRREAPHDDALPLVTRDVDPAAALAVSSRRIHRGCNGIRRLHRWTTPPPEHQPGVR